ncbi:hypothetical protein BSLA_03r1640 [Burkholderia stabilis]|nr:hypothetical protein BSLA_03r1640 [Burkholderia stabilis]
MCRQREQFSTLAHRVVALIFEASQRDGAGLACKSILMTSIPKMDRTLLHAR